MTDIKDLPKPTKRYRPSKKPAAEIQQHCHIFFDESLYHSALSLLGDLVTAGASHPNCLNRPAITPIPFHIELVSALLVHPRWTTHLLPNESPDLPARAMTLLRNILSILGPLNANLGEAFSLSEPEILRSRGGRGRYVTEPDSSGSEEDRPDRMQGIIANGGRLRRCAKDFWHIVGWAFNCSVKYPKRWQYWKVWLEFMFDVLDEDYEERERMDMEKHDGEGKKEPEYQMLRKSLLVEYLAHIRGRSTALKRVTRSIFADGGAASLKEFPEVYPNETKIPKHEQGQKRKRVDGMAEGKFGDYDDEMGEKDFQSPKSTPSDDGEEESDVDVHLGGTDSIALRQRIMALLSRASSHIEEDFVDTRNLYDTFYEALRPIPVPAFSLFLSPSRTSLLPTVAQVSLIQLLLLRLLPNDAPRPYTISKHIHDDISQDILEKCYLPFSAISTDAGDNAKVAVLIECLFRIYLKACECYHTPGLDDAIERGIKAREEKVREGERKGKKKSAKVKRGEEGDKALMRASGERLRSLFSWIGHRKLAER